MFEKSYNYSDIKGMEVEVIYKEKFFDTTFFVAVFFVVFFELFVAFFTAIVC